VKSKQKTRGQSRSEILLPLNGPSNVSVGGGGGTCQ
jgi:hypothetical protein